VNLETEPGIFVRLERLSGPAGGAEPKRILLFVQTAGKETPLPDWIEKVREPSDRIYRCEPRGIGNTRWTAKNPPNTILRSHVLVGRTVDSGRVHDVIAVARHLRTRHADAPIHIVGEASGAILAAYAALWESEIAGVIARQPAATHMDPAAPQFLNVLRVADVPEILGLVAPRPMTIISDDERFQTTAAIYKVAGAADSLTIRQVDGK
jgi:pimeloyl-ACP methyl ester carboxylesterase